MEAVSGWVWIFSGIDQSSPPPCRLYALLGKIYLKN